MVEKVKLFKPILDESTNTNKLVCGTCESEILEFWNSDKTIIRLGCPKCDADQSSFKTMGYAQYRYLAGICETCRAPVNTHPVCQACGALGGQGHLFTLVIYQKRMLCTWCIRSWQILEKEGGKLLTWEQVRKKWFPYEPRGRTPAKDKVATDN